MGVYYKHTKCHQRNDPTIPWTENDPYLHTPDSFWFMTTNILKISGKKCAVQHIKNLGKSHGGTAFFMTLNVIFAYIFSDILLAIQSTSTNILDVKCIHKVGLSHTKKFFLD